MYTQAGCVTTLVERETNTLVLNSQLVTFSGQRVCSRRLFGSLHLIKEMLLSNISVSFEHHSGGSVCQEESVKYSSLEKY